MTATLSAPQSIESWLGEEGQDLLTYKAKVSKNLLHLPFHAIQDVYLSPDLTLA